MTATVIHGDARAVLPTLDLAGAVVITDPPWPSGDGIDIVGAGAAADGLWREVAPLLGAARAVVVFQSSLDPPFAPPPQPFMQTCWMRSVPPSYRGRRILAHVAYVYGSPLIPPGARVFAGESVSVATAESIAERRSATHPCPMSMAHARWLVRWFGHGSRVVDPFAGGGAILRAAAERGLDSIGIDCDERWLPSIARSVARGEAQGRLPLAEGA